MKHYQEYEGYVELILNGESYTTTVPSYVESLSERLGGETDKLLNFISCLDAYQEDAEFTEKLAFSTADNYVEWFLDSEIPEEDPEWHQEVIDYYEGVVKRLKEGKL